MSLSREMCEALAEEYPRMRDRQWNDRDLVWAHAVYWHEGSKRDSWDLLAVRELREAPSSTARTPKWRLDTWCPGLEDLLSMAQSHAKCVHLKTNCCGEPWGLHDCADIDVEDHGHGNTPEEAIAAWLIAHAKEGDTDVPIS